MSTLAGIWPLPPLRTVQPACPRPDAGPVPSTGPRHRHCRAARATRWVRSWAQPWARLPQPAKPDAVVGRQACPRHGRRMAAIPMPACRRRRAAHWNPSPPHLRACNLHDRVCNAPRADGNARPEIPRLPGVATAHAIISGSQASGEQIRRTCDASHYCATLRKTSEALVPPNPNEFDSAMLTGRFRA
jgi:hypothetical protein